MCFSTHLYSFYNPPPLEMFFDPSLVPAQSETVPLQHIWVSEPRHGRIPWTCIDPPHAIYPSHSNGNGCVSGCGFRCVWVGWRSQKLVPFAVESIKNPSHQLMALQLMHLCCSWSFCSRPVQSIKCSFCPALLLSLLRPVVFVTEGGYYYSYYCKQRAVERENKK